MSEHALPRLPNYDTIRLCKDISKLRQEQGHILRNFFTMAGHKIYVTGSLYQIMPVHTTHIDQ